MRGPCWDDPREPWDDEYYTARPAAAPAPDAYVTYVEVNDEMVQREPSFPFGFQAPNPRPRSSQRLPSRQQRALTHRRNR